MSKRVHKSFPLENHFPERINFLDLKFDDSGYKVRVFEFANPGGPIYEINFGRMPLAQRSMDEGKFLAMTSTSHPDDRQMAPIVLVTGSDLLDWFHEQCCGMFAKDEVKHVAILTQNEWVEVLYLELPEIRKVIAYFPFVSSI
ncbi:hypothetical protein [Paracoccus sp. (in: a-proteobacteria)]|uniref:hypothetical protein n=1 Tax=Paracoccus sp. TaxID=267 RepID=UPI0026DF06D2|nr:hypothetical protein [Paracoccus sp. (in: a-proteobacteria)]MDO5648760.1 hypothetical protein [Paracoccus sp. (in: a-proteobacteria)]